MSFWTARRVVRRAIRNLLSACGRRLLVVISYNRFCRPPFVDRRRSSSRRQDMTTAHSIRLCWHRAYGRLNPSTVHRNAIERKLSSGNAHRLAVCPAGVSNPNAGTGRGKQTRLRIGNSGKPARTKTAFIFCKRLLLSVPGNKDVGRLLIYFSKTIGRREHGEPAGMQGRRTRVDGRRR